MRRSVVVCAVLCGLAWIAGIVVAARYDAYRIPSGAMEPTLGPGDRVLVRTGAAPSRGDVVVFEREGGARVSRVVGVGGDRLDSRDGRLRLDGRALEEPYLAAGTGTTHVDEVDVPSGEIFLLGDNRTDSADSRVYGPVPAASVIGVVEIVNVPLDWLAVAAIVLSGLALGIVLAAPAIRGRAGAERSLWQESRS